MLPSECGVKCFHLLNSQVFCCFSGFRDRVPIYPPSFSCGIIIVCHALFYQVKYICLLECLFKLSPVPVLFFKSCFILLFLCLNPESSAYKMLEPRPPPWGTSLASAPLWVLVALVKESQESQTLILYGRAFTSLDKVSLCSPGGIQAY